LKNSKFANEKIPMSNNSIIKIDVDSILKQRLPKMYKHIPRCAVEWLKRTICQERLNQLLEENAGLEGAEFCRGVLKSLNISINTKFENRLLNPEHRRVLYVSNHPLGGLDGMALIDYVQRRHGGKVYFVVNDLLTAIKPLESVFLPINKFGKQDRSAVKAIDEAFEGDDPIIMFPAGLVSRLQKVPFQRVRKKMVVDLQWNKMFVNKAYQYQRDVIPLFFSGQNSQHFYKMANLRTKLGIKFNFEMILLPSEMLKMENSTFTIACGGPISWQMLTPGPDALGCARAVGAYVYNIHADNPDLPIFSNLKIEQ
jgi:putative hemolysin